MLGTPCKPCFANAVRQACVVPMALACGSTPSNAAEKLNLFIPIRVRIVGVQEAHMPRLYYEFIVRLKKDAELVCIAHLLSRQQRLVRPSQATCDLQRRQSCVAHAARS